MPLESQLFRSLDGGQDCAKSELFLYWCYEQGVEFDFLAKGVPRHFLHFVSMYGDRERLKEAKKWFQGFLYDGPQNGGIFQL